MRNTLLLALLTLICPPLATPAKTPVAVLSDDPICLAWVVSNEAKGEPLRGQKAVYDVVQHRMSLRKKTACEVVKEAHQFSGYHKGMHLHVDDLMLTRLEKLRKMAPVVRDCDYFHAVYVKPAWRLKMQKCEQINNHIFYRIPPKEKHK